MASSRGTSNGPDWKDIASALWAFESQEKCDVRITIEAAGSAEVPDLTIQAEAMQGGVSCLEALCLASASVTCSATRLASLESVLFQLLYALDFQSAANEYLRSRDK